MLSKHPFRVVLHQFQVTSCEFNESYLIQISWADPGGGGWGLDPPQPPGKSQVAIGFLRKSGMEPT